jgi:cyclopropane fatty-acyl-phospholipid synthase-like methyltransferase
MSNFQLYYTVTYRRARDESKIDWHSDEPPRLLVEVVDALGGYGRAMDIGCGTGVNSVFMAQHGLQVTALDFVPEALRFGIKRAQRSGVKVDFIAADVTKYETADKYDLILDSGCFHGFKDRYRLLYRERLLNWLSDGGQYVLIHFGRRHALGLIGPRSRTREEIEDYFAPELRLENFLSETWGKPLFQYRFRKAGE